MDGTFSMGVHGRIKSNINVNLAAEDNIRIMSAAGGGSPRLRAPLNPRAGKDGIDNSDASSSSRSNTLLTLTGAKKMKDYGEFLRKTDESFYLHPQSFHRYLSALFGDLYRDHEAKAVAGPLVDGRQEIVFPRITFGQVDGMEYLLRLARINNGGIYSFDLELYKRNNLRERLITKSTVLSTGSQNSKIEDPQDKLMFKGLLKFLDMEAGHIFPSNYHVLGKNPS